MTISLIGSRATGKTTVGQQLAARLGWAFVDLDRELQLRAGKSITEIFAESGEPNFRQLESQLLVEHLLQDQLVISTGGGVVLDEMNRMQLQQSGPVIWLRASVETIVERLRKDETTAASRPSLTGKDVDAEVAEILAAREPLYRETASLTVETDDRDVTGIVDEIISQLPDLGKGCW
ncbi:MAG: shikimate kinase AroL [Planctomycetaceae bacterium]|nr:shikimate kinase AroL [Planctomycetaceae bacterium]